MKFITSFVDEQVGPLARYVYDELGNLNKIIRPDGQEISHLTYGSGHVYGIALKKKDMVGFKRDDLHRETERYLSNGLIQSNQYNDVGLLMTQVIQPEQETQDFIQHQAHRQYSYDKNYLLSQVKDTRLGKLNYQYEVNLIDPIATQTSQIESNLIQEYQGKR